jgi:hypothetical protein
MERGMGHGFQRTMESSGNIPGPETGERVFDRGENDDGIIRRIRQLVEEYKMLQNSREPEKSDLRPDYRQKPGAEKIEEIIQLMGRMGKRLKDEEALRSALKEGDVGPLDRLINPMKSEAPAEL